MQATSIRDCEKFTFLPPSILALRRLSDRLGTVFLEAVSDEYPVRPVLARLTAAARHQYVWVRVASAEIGFRIGIAHESKHICEDLFDPSMIDLPKDIQLAYATQQLCRLLECLENLLGRTFTLQELQSNAPNEGWVIALDTDERRQVCGADGAVVIAPDSDTLLMDLLASFPESPMAPDISLPVLVSIEYGRAKLSLVEIRSMEPGDIVLLERIHADDNLPMPALIVENAVRASGHIKQNTFEIVSITNVGKGRSMSEIMEENLVPAVSTGGLELEVTAICGTYGASINDISSWKSGSIVSLGVPIDSSRITLMIGRQTVARGRLVGVGEHFGVEITDLYIR
jgi:type III secretion system YscQ/HrcQ family protein